VHFGENGLITKTQICHYEGMENKRVDKIGLKRRRLGRMDLGFVERS